MGDGGTYMTFLYKSFKITDGTMMLGGSGDISWPVRGFVSNVVKWDYGNLISSGALFNKWPSP